MKIIISISLFFLAISASAQGKSEAFKFWESLKKHCNKSFEGSLLSTPANDDFAGKKLVMHVRACDDNTIRIPFFVGDNKSRTWILTFENDRIQLKHDHRHEDGSEDKVTQYGGKATNSGSANIQIFPADQQTTDLLPHASTNVWWITLDDRSFSYNLRRMGSDRLFTVFFDLTKTVENPSAPWGWK
ncbi:hypothetical protein [Dyadobacter sp. CY312]|uniref:hypothetical protein n=1 Tax=Dyadobacter sp. CY312 TaxID=2907303 RepID=UPI001F407AE4|nr:hypothetical protein [Dyadobacter sp. CY312]MCE7040617.1 hypothetical protein [Dyadobacter sp. CY312]